jgi:hypothetical protein
MAFVAWALDTIAATLTPPDLAEPPPAVTGEGPTTPNTPAELLGEGRPDDGRRPSAPAAIPPEDGRERRRGSALAAGQGQLRAVEVRGPETGLKSKDVAYWLITPGWPLPPGRNS